MAYAAQGYAGTGIDRVPSGPACIRSCRRCGAGRSGDQRTTYPLWPCYRIYIHRHGNTVVILLCDGDKGSQAKDIKNAKRLLDEWMN